MSNTITTYDVVPINKGELDFLVVRKITRKGNLYSLDVGAHTTYDKPVALIYADHEDAALEQLDELIGKLQAIRQDLDVTSKE